MLEAIEAFESDRGERRNPLNEDATSLYKAELGKMTKAVLEEAKYLDDPVTFSKHVTMLCLARNFARAKKLVDVLEDFVPRLWWLIPLKIVLWPFIFIYRIIRLGL